MPESPQDRHKNIINRLYEEAWSTADFSSLEELLAPEFTFHVRSMSFSQQPGDLAGIISRWKQAFPDIRFEVRDLVAEDDRAAARVTYTGTHTGPWKDIPPTGRKVTVHEMLFFRFENGRIAEVWEVPDEFSLRTQLLANSD